MNKACCLLVSFEGRRTEGKDVSLIEEIKKMLKSIKLFVYDFDGVMTDNTAILSEDGKESVIVSRADGLAISEIRKMQIAQIILSTETNPVVQKRAEKLGIPVIFGSQNKKEALWVYCRENHINLDEVAYVGNDINDYEAMMSVGVRVCPSDAEREIKEIADIMLTRKGGQGVVRELLNFIF